MESPFHLAFPVKNIESTKFFYKEVLGCKIGREDKKWVDFNFFGHQLSAHLKPEELQKTKENPVDGKSVPVRHFGVILPWEKWQLLSKKLIKINTEFIIEPYVRFEGEIGEVAGQSAVNLIKRVEKIQDEN